jgi:hypothetical protein
VRRHLSEPNTISEASHKTTFDIEDQHYFTPQEASKLLPDIKLKVKQLIEHKKVVSKLHDEMEKYNLLGFRTDEIAEKAAELDAMVDEMTKEISELEDLGVIVKDLEYGLVDFPADRYGEKVLLCWRYGESEVSFWHKPNEGFNGRKPLYVQTIQP